MYRRIVYPVFERFDTERSHDAVLRGLSRLNRAPVLLRGMSRLLRVDDPRLAVELCGLRFPNPLGMAAGLDKNAAAVEVWGALGFGHVEVGTVTPEPQAGNPRPRMFRLAADDALINRMGFPSHGAREVHVRLQRRRPDGVLVGVNLGANKASVEVGRAVDDYLQGLAQLYAVADYVAINISSPNTARLRELQGAAALRELLRAVLERRDAMSVHKPIFVKIAPDLSPAELEAIVVAGLDVGVDGVIATNTTVERPKLTSAARDETGGLSGRPLFQRSTDVVRAVCRLSDWRLPVIAVGGVFTAEDVWAKLLAGASLVQLYTGFVYGGPLVARRINRQLGSLLLQHGFASIADLQAAVRGTSTPDA